MLASPKGSCTRDMRAGPANEQLPRVEQLPDGVRLLHLNESHAMNVVGIAELDGIPTRHNGCEGTIALQIPAESWELVSKALFIPDTV